MTVVGFLGTGLMGAPMAANLARAGHTVRAWNRSADKTQALSQQGVQPCPTIEDALSGADVALVMVSDGPTSDLVLFGDGSGPEPVKRLAPGGTILVMSSIPPETAKAQADRARGLGLSYLDAPVSGGEVGAKAASLVIMVGGDPAVYEQQRSLLQAMGRPSLMGTAGAGSLAKLCNQAIVAVTIGAVSEAMLLARAGGVDPAALRDALMGGFASSRILELHGKRMVMADFQPGGPARHQLKDLRMVTKQAHDLGLRLPITELLESLFLGLCDKGDAGLDHSALIREIARINDRPDLAEASS